MRPTATDYQITFSDHGSHTHFELKNDDSPNHVHDSGCNDCEEGDETGYGNL